MATKKAEMEKCRAKIGNLKKKRDVEKVKRDQCQKAIDELRRERHDPTTDEVVEATMLTDLQVIDKKIGGHDDKISTIDTDIVEQETRINQLERKRPGRKAGMKKV